MRLVLTYHRIVERAGGTATGPYPDADLYDMTTAELSRHIALARRFWGHDTSVERLLQPTRPRGFLVTFDDGTVDHYETAAPVLERSGVRGVFFVNTGVLDTPGFMTFAQCRELQSRGHAVESHAHEHVNLTELSGADLGRQLTESRRMLREAGLGQYDFLAPPGGCFNPRVTEAATACGYRLLRTLEWGYNVRFDPLRVASITMNRQTGPWCQLLLSPRGALAKRTLYRLKEAVKDGSPGLYFGVRSAGQVIRRLDGASARRVRR